jgi:hypothetical protein
MRRLNLLPPAVLLPIMALAEEPLSGDAFDALSRDRTLWFERGGTFYGAEQFLSGRRSLWLYPDGSCAHGEWFEAEGLICFVYEGAPARQCWRMTIDEGTLAAELVVEGAPTGEVVTLVRKDQAPLSCPGPQVGS